MVDGASLLMQMTWAFYGQGRVGGRAGGQPARRRRALLRHLHVRRRPARRRRPAGAAVLRRSCSTGSGSTRRRCRPRTTSPAGRCCGPGSPRRSRARTRDEWAAVFDGTEACVTPVLALGEVAEHPHLKARGTIVAPGRRAAGRARAAVLPHPRDAARAAGASRRTSRRCSRTGRADPKTTAPRRPVGRRGASHVLRQADGVSSTSRLRVRFGSTGMPGPVVVETVTFFR